MCVTQGSCLQPAVWCLSVCLSVIIIIAAGPPSSVELQTQYLDERVRLGKGSRGSLFVFTRGGAADTAGGCLARQT